jgi:hypothetical protein
MNGGDLCMRSDPHTHRPTLVLLANGRSSRIRHWQQAAKSIPDLSLRVVEWHDWLRGGDDLPLALRTARWLRVESPGEDWGLERLLLARGAGARAAEGGVPLEAVDLDRLTGQRGSIVSPRQWYLGLCQTLREIDALLPQFPHVQSLTPVDAVGCLFDKGLCQPRFVEAGLPVPEFHLGIRGYDELRAVLPGQCGRWMLKLRHGFSALGSVALHWQPGRVRALTTTEIETTPAGERLLLSKRLQSLTDERQIARLVDRLAPEGWIVESWLPKRLCDGVPFDLRCVVIGGTARHLLGRGAASPFTNLNLNGRRIQAEDLRHLMPDMVDVVRDHAAKAAACFPGMLSVGVDVLLRPDDRLAILEANAFGDYLPELRDRGETPHEAFLSVLASSCRDGLELGAGDRETTKDDRIRPRAEVVK